MCVRVCSGIHTIALTSRASQGTWVPSSTGLWVSQDAIYQGCAAQHMGLLWTTTLHSESVRHKALSV